jgi:hypothetical protein
MLKSERGQMQLYAGLARLSSSAIAWSGVRLSGVKRARPRSGASVEALISRHFAAIGEPCHPSRPTLTDALARLGGRPARIIETGTAAWGTRSTLLFSSYVEQFGGSLITIDTRVSPAIRTFRSTVRTVKYFVGDSVSVLARPSVQDFARRTDLVYLDSWDVDSHDPVASAQHGLREFLALDGYLPAGALVLIDDTPATQSKWGDSTPAMTDFLESWGVPVGKGAFVLKVACGGQSYRLLSHDYQLLMEKVTATASPQG